MTTKPWSDSRYVTREADWTDSADLRQWLRDEVFVGRTLNFPCGNSPLGDVRADVDPAVEPDVVADLYEPPFEERSFDTVYCDPPYGFYGGDQFKFVNPLWDIASKRLIFQSNPVRIHLKNSKKRWFVNEARKSGKSVLLFQVFDQPNFTLNEFDGGVRR